jgi:hypothetical protein
LISVEGYYPGIASPYDHPTGMVIYDPSGHMSVQIAFHSDRKPLANPFSATLEEKASTFDTYVAYYGTYAINAKARTVTHHLIDCTRPNFRGVDWVRYYEFQGNDRLVLLVAEDLKGGLIPRKDITYKLLWGRIK